MRPPYLLLDIDGVLIPFPDAEGSPPATHARHDVVPAGRSADNPVSIWLNPDHGRLLMDVIRTGLVTGVRAVGSRSEPRVRRVLAGATTTSSHRSTTTGARPRRTADEVNALAPPEVRSAVQRLCAAVAETALRPNDAASRAIRVRRACFVGDHGEDVQRRSVQGVAVKEVAGRDRVGLASQERGPGLTVTFGRQPVLTS
ncbi:hypothetical protein [Streptomyces mirabilis]|uniref:hypothetical protein n=1 Tax=Streptomyces mirabilis TaxID=68239 RepID=UPI003823AE44